MCECVVNRRRLALLAGQDAVAPLPEDLRRILANCPHCREHYEQLQISQRVLEQMQEDAGCVLSRSLWPELAPRLVSRPPQSPWLGRFKQRFIPAFSLTAACLALLMVFLDGNSLAPRTYRTAVTTGESYSPLPLVTVGNPSQSSINSSNPLWAGDSRLPLIQASPPHRLSTGAPWDSPATGEDAWTPSQPDSRERLLLDMLRLEFERELQRLPR
ncbi:MAG: hypothetical protein KDA76_00870 [Planctomycetaceae bacterium]|nr:hypothetical protein [Planctomycetaceae bacterium]